MTTTEVCMHELDPSTCSVCKYTLLPPVYISGRGATYHTDPECAALLADREAVKKRGGVMTPVVAARPGTTALDGRSACTVCA